MAFKKLDHAPDGTAGETYINPDNIAEVTVEQTPVNETMARVTYVGGSQSTFIDAAAKELIEKVLARKADRTH